MRLICMWIIIAIHACFGSTSGNQLKNLCPENVENAFVDVNLQKKYFFRNDSCRKIVVEVDAFFQLREKRPMFSDFNSVTLPLLLDGKVESFSINTTSLTRHSIRNQLLQFCAEHQLQVLYCNTLLDYSIQQINFLQSQQHCSNRMLNQSTIVVKVCMKFNSEHALCTSILSIGPNSTSKEFFTIRNIPAGINRISVWIEASHYKQKQRSEVKMYFKSIVNKDFFMLPEVCQQETVIVKFPTEGSRTAENITVLLDYLNVGKSEEIMFCSQIDENISTIDCSLFIRGSNFRIANFSDEPKSFKKVTELEKSVQISIDFSGLSEGYHKLVVWNFPSKAIFDAMTYHCQTIVSFEVVRISPNRTRQPNNLDNAKTLGSIIEPMMIVTAISQQYFDEFRIHNLIGSIHYWEPTLKIHIVSLDLNDESKGIISDWKNVYLTDFPKHLYPEHVSNFRQTYAFKYLVIQEAVHSMSQSIWIYQNINSILWLDANIELRRPIDQVRYEMQKHFYFFTIQGAKFPLLSNHKITLLAFSCKDKLNTRTVCASGFQGYVKNKWAATELLPKLVTCSLNETCIAPPGARYPDQTVLNAAFCGYNIMPCLFDEKYWLSSSVDDQVKALQPTSDETQWNALVFYTRRELPKKPYVKFLKLKICKDE